MMVAAVSERVQSIFFNSNLSDIFLVCTQITEQPLPHVDTEYMHIYGQLTGSCNTAQCWASLKSDLWSHRLYAD